MQFYQQVWRKVNGTPSDKLIGILATGTDEQGREWYYTSHHYGGFMGGTTLIQQDAEQAQKFLNEQMDNIMLTLYKENPQLMQETMEKNHQFYANGGLKNSDYPSLGIDEKLSDLLLDYGARTESERLEEVFSDYLEGITNSLKDYIAGEEIDFTTLQDIKANINQYRANKMRSTGYDFFAAVTDKLSPALQEQITDAIAQVMSFYSQPHSMEINGYKISWKSQYDTAALGTLFGVSGGVLTSVACTDISIEFSSGFTPTLSQDTLLSLASTFDSSQTFFEVLEQRNKLEKENQDLKTRQAYNARGISNTMNSIQTDSASDSIMQTLLKEAKDSKENPKT